MKSWIPFFTPILPMEKMKLFGPQNMKVLWVAQWYGGWFRNPKANHIGCFLTPCKLRGCTTNLNWWVNPGVLVAINSSYFKKTWGKMLGKPLGCCFFPFIPSTPIYTKKYHVESGFFYWMPTSAPQKKKTPTFHESSWLVHDGILMSWFMK